MTFPSIPFLLVRGVLRAHWCCGRSAEQLCLLKPYQHRKPTCDFSFMNVNFTSWCGHGACSTSNIGPITVLENFYFEAEGMGGVAPAVICVTAHLSKLFCLGLWCNFTFSRPALSFGAIQEAQSDSSNSHSHLKNPFKTLM